MESLIKEWERRNTTTQCRPAGSRVAMQDFKRERKANARRSRIMQRINYEQ